MACASVRCANGREGRKERRKHLSSDFSSPFHSLMILCLGVWKIWSGELLQGVGGTKRKEEEKNETR